MNPVIDLTLALQPGVPLNVLGLQEHSPVAADEGMVRVFSSHTLVEERFQDGLLLLSLPEARVGNTIRWYGVSASPSQGMGIIPYAIDHIGGQAATSITAPCLCKRGQLRPEQDASTSEINMARLYADKVPSFYWSHDVTDSGREDFRITLHLYGRPKSDGSHEERLGTRVLSVSIVIP
ncbi:hypothetical protein [Chromobacterium haemolyticum]|uniref:hypothetical protein n=1 Tax=Chromobacterium TaxID=535 RepID=UPI004056E539